MDDQRFCILANYQCGDDNGDIGPTISEQLQVRSNVRSNVRSTVELSVLCSGIHSAVSSVHPSSVSCAFAPQRSKTRTTGCGVSLFNKVVCFWLSPATAKSSCTAHGFCCEVTFRKYLPKLHLQQILEKETLWPIFIQRTKVVNFG